MAGVRRVLLDSNIIDALMAQSGGYEAARAALETGSHEFLFTHVNVDELAKIPDLDRRQHLMLVLIDLGTLVPTGAMALDYSRLNFCRVVDDPDVVEAVRGGNLRHTRDALLVATALFEMCALATDDLRLQKRSRDRGVEVISSGDLLEELGVG